MKHPALRPAALLSAALLALLCACAPAGTAAPTPTPTPASAPDAAASAGPSAGAPLEQPVSTGFENLTQVSGSSYGSGSGEGFYELIARQDGSANLRYIDYASAREIYLCAAPNCTHDNESCPSWLADPACSPLVVGDRLLLFYPSPSTMAGRPMQILKAGLDGSDRQTLIEFDASESCRSLVSANDHLLVMLVTRTDDTGADVEQGLVLGQPGYRRAQQLLHRAGGDVAPVPGRDRKRLLHPVHRAGDPAGRGFPRHGVEREQGQDLKQPGAPLDGGAAGRQPGQRDLPGGRRPAVHGGGRRHLCL